MRQVDLIGDWEYLGRVKDDQQALRLRCHYCGAEHIRDRQELKEGIGIFCLDCQLRRVAEAAEAVERLAPPTTRLGTRIKNLRNKSKTGCRGIYFTRDDAFSVQIRIAGVTEYVGTYPALDAAIAARDAAEESAAKGFPVFKRREGRAGRASLDRPNKSNTRSFVVVDAKQKICKECGSKFLGAKTARYCDECRIKRTRASAKESQYQRYKKSKAAKQDGAPE